MESRTKSVKYTIKEKMNILAEAAKNGVKLTLEKYYLFPATFYFWKKKQPVYGKSGLDHKTQTEQLKRMKALEMEKHHLKIMLADKEPGSNLKDEHYKKSIPG